MIHKEGYKILSSLLLVLGIINLCVFVEVPLVWLNYVVLGITLVLFLMVLQFFRNPKRYTIVNDKHVIAPVDGKVVVIEDVEEPEYFKDKRKQISIFMSPTDVHVTRYPISGNICFSRYHSGRFLVAWHPKSSIKNERTTVVVESSVAGKVLFRQIAGALARRIVNYAKIDQHVRQGEDSGFIKFGSRVDVFIPTSAEVNVVLNQKTRGGETVIAEIL